MESSAPPSGWCQEGRGANRQRVGGQKQRGGQNRGLMGCIELPGTPVGALAGGFCLVNFSQGHRKNSV